MKPVYVQYIAYRRNVTNNPSWDRFSDLDYEEQVRLFDKWETNHKKRMKRNPEYAKLVKGATRLANKERKGFETQHEQTTRSQVSEGEIGKGRKLRSPKVHAS